MKKIGISFVALFAASAALAQQGMFGTYPTATPPLTGNETVAADTNLSGGAYPQTEKFSMDTLKSFMFGGYADPTTKTATAAAGAVTLNSGRGVITSEALTTAAAAVYTLTWTNAAVAATSLPLCTVGNGTNTTVAPALNSVTPAAGSVVIVVRNAHAAAALNGTIKVNCAFVN